MIKKIALIEFLSKLSNGDQVTFKKLKEALEKTESARCCNPSEYNLKALAHYGYIKVYDEGLTILDLIGALTWLDREPIKRSTGKSGRFGKRPDGFEVAAKVPGWNVITNGEEVIVISSAKRVGRVTFRLTYKPNGQIRNNQPKWDLSLKSLAAVYAAEEVAKEIVRRKK